MSFLEPWELAREEHQLVTPLSAEQRASWVEQVIQRYLDPPQRKQGVSWSDRLINSFRQFPTCCLHSLYTDTKWWLSVGLREYWANTRLWVSGGLYRNNLIYLFEDGAYCSDICFRSTLCLERELFFTNEEMDWLVCWTELEHLLCFGSIVPWLCAKTEGTEDGEHLGVLWERPQ